MLLIVTLLYTYIFVYLLLQKFHFQKYSHICCQVLAVLRVIKHKRVYYCYYLRLYTHMRADYFLIFPHKHSGTQTHIQEKTGFWHLFTIVCLLCDYSIASKSTTALLKVSLFYLKTHIFHITRSISLYEIFLYSVSLCDRFVFSVCLFELSNKKKIFDLTWLVFVSFISNTNAR